MEWQDLAQLPVSIFKDYVTDSQDAEKPFIWTEVFLREINRSNQEIILHIWPMTKTVIL
ncbi:protein--protein lipoyl transferase, partial [Streptococcus agalactiae]|nr:protein--protein lipoyl transferase [Streptococcus agalactiae]